MENMIFPEIFEGFIMGFFTDREISVDVEHITGRNVYFPIQEHSNIVKSLNSDLSPAVADAVITDRRDLLLGVKTADCVPMLLFDRRNSAIGAVHAGWRGTAGGILNKTVESMAGKYKTRPEDLMLAIGPSIKWCCYEVKKDVLNAVRKATGEGEYHRRKKNKYCLDLQYANLYQAIASGLKTRNISMIEECTYCHPEKYHSYRYEKGTEGRQGGFIGFP